LEKVSLG
jgi:hypothetical protein